MTLLRALAAVLFSGAFAWADSACEADLRAAAADDYDVVTLSKPGHATLVILGEGHYKTERAADLGRRVLAHFEHVGIESRDPESTWGQRVRRRLRPRRESPLLAARRAEASLPTARTEGSTVYEAQRLSMRWRIYAAVRDAAPDRVQNLLEKLADDPDDEFLVGEEGVVMTRDEVTDLIRARLDGTLDPRAAFPTMFTHRLEDAHRPGPVEQLASLELGHRDTFFAWWAIGLGGATWLPAEAAPWSMLAFVPVAYRWVSQRVVTDFRQYHARWVRTLFPLAGGLIHGRDRTMARAAEDLSAHLPGADVLIMIGRGHVAGVVAHLRRRGFAP